MDYFANLLCVLAIGFWWGEWRGERKARAKSEFSDAGSRLLFSMVEAVRGKRPFVGYRCSITRTERFDFMGEKYSLSLCSEGDPNVISSSLEAE